MKNLKFVWEFFGPDSKKLAQHHLEHLNEFLKKENIKSSDSGVSFESDNFSYSYTILDESLLEVIKTSLKPHKAFRL